MSIKTDQIMFMMVMRKKSLKLEFYFLWSCVRNSLLKLISTPIEKSILIKEQISEIEKNDYWS